MVVGDLMNSITLLVYKAAEGSLEVSSLPLGQVAMLQLLVNTVYIVSIVSTVPAVLHSDGKQLNLLGCDIFSKSTRADHRLTGGSGGPC